jgi:hypothetical protein
VTHAAGQVSATPVTGFNITGVLSDAIVNCINRFNEFLRGFRNGFFGLKTPTNPVHFEPQNVDFFIVAKKLESVGNNVLAEMPIKQKGRYSWVDF